MRRAITDAITERDQALNVTLARLEQNDAEAAELLREMRDQLAAAREAGHVVDPDAATIAYSAAEMLQHLPDSAQATLVAAEALAETVDILSGMQELPQRLEAAADRREQNQQFM